MNADLETRFENLERHYRQLCPSIREICFLPGNQAIVVPDFGYLRHRHIVNSANVVRFEMDAAAEQLPRGGREYQLTLRSSPLPRLGGKVDRMQVAQQVRNYRGVPESVGATSASALRVLEVIGQFKPDVPVSSEMNIEIDLGFDSLERVQLIAAIERSFGLEIPSADLDRFLVVGDLIRYLETGVSGAVDDHRIIVPSWHEILNAPLTIEEAQEEQLVLAPRSLLRLIMFPILCLMLLVARLLFRVRHSGSRELPTQPFAFCINHNSHLDPLFLACALPLRLIRRLLFLGFSEYFASGRFLWLWRTLRVAPIDPDRYARSGLRLTIAGLRRNFVPCFFPEGSRSASGQLQPFQSGLAVVARESATPVVPVAIIGSYEVLPRGSNRIRFRSVEVRFGKAVIPSPAVDLTRELYSAVTKLLSNAEGL